MKKINVIVRDRNTLIIDDNADKGDYIDLSSLANVDLSTLEAVIDSGRDSIYNKKLEEFKQIIKLEQNNEILNIKSKYNSQIEDLNNTINQIKRDNEANNKLLRANLEKEYEDRINSLNNEIKGYELVKRNEILKIEAEKNLEINNLRSKYEIEKSKRDLENEKYIQNIINEYNLKLADKEKLIQEKDNAYLSLQRQKASLNVKQTGEDLEAWCDNEMISYMQNGLSNCTWIKDNKVVREDGEYKGSKADYIFNVYASDKHLDEELLANVCLDMKDENPDSVNKKKNSDYYTALDKNRTKKNCKYAVLVSNLESDKPNDLPIFKVNEYPDMYVVRPAYMMTLLNMIASLSKRFAELILADNDNKLELKNSIDLISEFESIKNTYLEKPLERLNKDVESIMKSNDAIISAAKKINDSCESIVKNYIDSIEKKLENFEIKINREYKKFNKVERIKL